MMILSLDSIAVLDAIARRGSFAAAASELGKVPSALTYTVRRLEEELDVLLFDRRGKRARLTAAGEELLERGRLLMRSADDIVCRVKEVASGWEVELRIAVDGVVAFEQVRSLIEDFYRLGAPTRLRFSYEVLDGGWDALLSGRADLAIGVSSETPAAAFASGLYTVRPLGAVRFVYCVAPHHPLAGLPEPLEPEVLVRHRAVVVANSARALPLRSAGLVSGQDTLTVATLEQKVAMQLAGLGGGLYYLSGTGQYTLVKSLLGMGFNGIPVALLEMKQEALDHGLATIRRNYENSMKKGKLTPEQVEQRMGLIERHQSDARFGRSQDELRAPLPVQVGEHLSGEVQAFVRPHRQAVRCFHWAKLSAGSDIHRREAS